MGWITDRFNCSLEVAFVDLKDAVAVDLAEANGLMLRDRREHGSYEIKEGENGRTRFKVVGLPLKLFPRSPNYEIWFELKDEEHICIEVCRRDKKETFIVTQRWCAEGNRCVLTLGERDVKVADISQIVLEKMIFG